MQQPQIYRVEVLSQDTQKYASTQVQGGGGHVMTVNGVTTGRLNEVRSTTTFHQDQSLWLRDASTGQELHIEFKDFSFPTRPGQVLTVLYDPESKDWERLVNETSGAVSYGRGKFNPDSVQRCIKEGRGGMVIGLALVIPFINLVAGLIALGATFAAIPVSYSCFPVLGARRRILLCLVTGCAAVFGSYVAAFGGSLLLRVPVGAASLYAAFLFGKFYKESFAEAASIGRKRSEVLDDALAMFRNRHSATAANPVNA
jgi:hypothetical protein